MSEVILWTLDDGNTVNRLEMDNNNEECYYFERLERVLATQVNYSNYLKGKWNCTKIKNILHILHSIFDIFMKMSGHGQAALESC